MRRYKGKREFYKGDDWAECKAEVLAERIKDGEVRCEHCGELILKDFTPHEKNAGAIVYHHKIPLTDYNVNDASISINKSNIAILHWQCHNIVHNRFCSASARQGARADQKVYLITGAPCSGKTTFVRERKGDGDIVLDIDDIWQLLTGLSRYEKPNSVKPIVFAVRDTIRDQIKTRSGTWYNAFVIEGLATAYDRRIRAEQLNVDEVITMDATEAECIQRLHERPNGRNIGEYEKYIRQYYEKYSP